MFERVIIRSSNNPGTKATKGSTHSNLCQIHIFVAFDNNSNRTIVVGDT